MNLSKREFFKAAACGAAFLPASTMATRPTAVQSPPSGIGRDYYTNAVLRTHDGRKVRFYDDLLKGRLVVINMMYTTCSGICPANTASIKAVQDALGRRVGTDIHFYSISLRPEFDTPQELFEYRRRYDINNSWTFLTGSRPDIDLIRRRLGFFDIDPAVDADLSQHTGMLRIGKVDASRWCMVPVMTSTKAVVDAILGVA